MKKFFAFLMAAVIFAFSGCAQETTTSRTGEGSIDPAVFCMEDQRFPRISIREDKTFTMTYTQMSNRLTRGTYSVDGNILTLSADDGAVYNFEIAKTSIIYIGETSTPFEVVYEDEPEIPDGTEFNLWRKHE
ncbi:MAG: lipocalin family protein [Clostridia bacterium]|nr:lipocalin family protein [Clostridia bacterium]